MQLFDASVALLGLLLTKFCPQVDPISVAFTLGLFAGSRGAEPREGPNLYLSFISVCMCVVTADYTGNSFLTRILYTVDHTVSTYPLRNDHIDEQFGRCEKAPANHGECLNESTMTPHALHED